MADIFISYARPDREKIEKLAAALEAEGWSVWWDRHIEAGAEFSADIERELDTAKAVIVCWSDEGSKSRWVKDEANIAAEAGKLLAVALDDDPPPIGFRQYHAAPFADWNGNKGAPAFQGLARTINSRVESAAEQSGGETTSSGTHKTTPAPTRGLSLLTLHKDYPKVWMGAVAVLVAIIGLSYLMTRSAPDDAAREVAAQTDGVDRSKSIAVLPFDDLSPAGDQEYFSDGIAEEILNVLARVDGLKVASRTSSFQFKSQNRSVPEIAGALGVRYVLEGSVRKAGDTVRITAQLIDAEIDMHLWSQTFDRTLNVENLFAIQDEISTTIVAELGGSMDLGRANTLRFAAAADTKNLRAYELYLEGRELFPERRFETLPLIIDKFELATNLDPEFARAWEGLAAIYMIAPSHQLNNPENDSFKSRAREAAAKALALDPNLPLAHVASNSFLIRRGGVPDYDSVINGLNKAIEVDAKEALVWSWRGQYYTDVGFFEKGESDLQKSMALDPTDGVSRQWLARNYVLQGRLDDALSLYGEEGVTNMQLNTIVSLALHARGEKERAEELVVDRVPPGVGRERLINAFFSPTDDPEVNKNEFLEALGDAGEHLRQFGIPNDLLYAFGDYANLQPIEPASGQTVWWYWMRPDYLDSPERYRLMREQGLEAYWRARGFPPQCRMINSLPNGRDYECD